jgi:hypothetical protein
MTVMKTWYAELANDVIHRRRIFAQVGSFHRTATFESDIQGALLDAGLRPVECRVDKLARTLDTADLEPGAVVVVPDFEEALLLAHPEAYLRRCRPNLQHAGEVGAAWLVISQVPESRYPLVDGSSVTIDSASYRMRCLHKDKLSGLPGVTARDVGTIARFAGGSRAIADSMIGLLASDLPRAEQVAEARRVTMEVLSCSLKELGPDLLAWLERWVLERDMLNISTADVRNDALFELRAAGIGEIDPVDERVRLFAPPHTATWRKALDTALSDLLEAPTQWESVVADLFYIERRLRRALATLLDGRYGRNWGTRLPEDMRGRIIESFRRNASARVHDITDIGRPLDWVTFGDLFELIPRFSPTSRLDGLSVAEWRAIADAILPIRDRVSHMRLLRDGDRQAVRNMRWRITNASGA